jgi:hypothetical protein
MELLIRAASKPSIHGETLKRPRRFDDDDDDKYTDGVPAHVRPGILKIDLRIYSRMKCPKCKTPTFDVRPQHHVRKNTYRLLLTCKTCGHKETA